MTAVESPVRRRWEDLRAFLDMIRFSHTLFALPFALIGALLAWRGVGFSWLDLLAILICMAGARSAAMAFNRIADRRFDAANPRTADRHLPSGRLTLASVVLFTLGSIVLFLAGTWLFLWHRDNSWPLILSGPVLLFLLGYSYAKRFTWLCHFWLGLALALAPIAAWIAITGGLTFVPVALGLAVLFWVAGFDIFYACQDVDFDRQQGLFSIPAWLGVPRALWVARLAHLGMFACLVLLGRLAERGWVYHAGLAAVALLLLYEHWLVRPDDLRRVNLAFFYVNAVISLGLLFLVGLDLWLVG